MQFLWRQSSHYCFGHPVLSTYDPFSEDPNVEVSCTEPGGRLFSHLFALQSRSLRLVLRFIKDY